MNGPGSFLGSGWVGEAGEGAGAGRVAPSLDPELAPLLPGTRTPDSPPFFPSSSLRPGLSAVPRGTSQTRV